MKSAATPLGHVRGRPERSLNAYRQVPKVVLFKYYSRLVLPQTRSILITVGAWTLGNQLFNSQKVAIQQLIMNSVLFKVLLDRCTQLRVHPSLCGLQKFLPQQLHWMTSRSIGDVGARRNPAAPESKPPVAVTSARGEYEGRRLHASTCFGYGAKGRLQPIGWNTK